MPTINQLPLRSPVSPGDQIPIYSPNNGDARRTPVSAVADLIVNGLDLPNTAVLLTGDQTIGGTKTFSNAIVGSITGNAGTVTNGVYTTGNQTIGGTKTFSNAIVGDITGNAGTATTAVTATTATTATTAGSVTNGVYTVGNQTIGGTKTFSVNPILSAGTVNAILALDGSKQISAVSGLTWDGTKSNLSLNGVTVGQGNVPSLNNIAFGSSALNAITTGYRNIGVGNDTLKVVTTGYNNLAIGTQSGQSLTTGFNNVFIGDGAGLSATTPRQNIAIGSSAAMSLTTGQDNVAVGAGAGFQLTLGSGNTFIGTGAGNNYTGNFSVFIGGNAGGSLNGTGTWNTCVGYNTGGSGGTSTYNTCIGFEAGKSLVNSGSNTLVGVRAGDQIQIGQGNTVIGRFNGNQSSLDIRLTDFNIVLSDGNGNPRSYYDGPNNAWIWRTGASERLRLDSSGNLVFSSTAQRITGNMTDATVGNRLAFQNSVTNGSTIVGAIPNGTSVTSVFRSFNNSDPANAGQVTFGINSGNAFIDVGITGTGAYLPLTFTVGASERMRISSGGDVGIGTSSPVGKLDIVTGTNRGYFDDSAGSLFRLNAVNAANSAYAPLSLNGSVLTFQIAASERMRITSAGDVGIGTTSPSAQLSQFSATSVARTIGTSTILQQEDVGGGVVNFGPVTNHPLVLRTNNQERMRIESSGNVGIGTSAPGRMLTVSSSSDTSIQSISSGANSYIQATGSAGSVYFGAISTAFGVLVGGSERMRITSGGNVGINDSNPGYLLTLTGASNPQVWVSATNVAGNSAGIGFENQGQRNWQIWADRSTDTLSFGNNSRGTTNLVIGNTGNVGIGTTNPAVRLEVAGQIRTEAPTGGTAANWRLGTVHTVTPTSPNRTIEVDIGGTIYYLHAKTTNN